MIGPEQIAEKRSWLETRLSELDHEMEDIEQALDSPAPKDSEDFASERQGDEVLEARGLSDQHEVAQIKAALDRIAAGTYGVCTKCGEDISMERLDALPATPFCRNCMR